MHHFECSIIFIHGRNVGAAFPDSESLNRTLFFCGSGVARSAITHLHGRVGRTWQWTIVAPASKDPWVDSTCSAIVIGTAGLLDFCGSEPVIATQIMQGSKGPLSIKTVQHVKEIDQAISELIGYLRLVIVQIGQNGANPGPLNNLVEIPAAIDALWRAKEHEMSL